MFKAMLRWVLLLLCVVHSHLVTGQVTTSVQTYTFPSVFPIGTNINELLRQRVDTLVVHGYLTYEVDGIRHYQELTPDSARSRFDAKPDITDDEIQMKAIPVANEIVQAGVKYMDDTFLGDYGINSAVILFAADLTESYWTSLYTSGYRMFYVIRNEDTGHFESGQVTDEVRFDQRPAYTSSSSNGEGTFIYRFPDSVDFVHMNSMLDAVDANGMPVTLSSYEGTLEQQVSQVILPEWVADGSLKGTLYLEVRSNKPNSVNQIVGIDLQSGKVDRPKIKFKKLWVRGPYFPNGPNGERYMEMRPTYEVPRGTTFVSYVSTNLASGKWTRSVRSHAGGGDPTPLVEFEQGIMSASLQAFTKAAVDDESYPPSILKVLPPSGK